MKKILRYSLLVALALMSTFANAAEPYKTLSFPDDNKDNNKAGKYTLTWEAKIGDDAWAIANFNNNSWNNWNYIKGGNKTAASVATIATKNTFAEAIGTVVVNIDAVTASSINSTSLVVATDAEFKNVVETVNGSELKVGYLTFKVTKTSKDNFYKVVFDCAKGAANGLVQVSKVKYYKAGDEVTYFDPTNTAETAYTIAEAKQIIDNGEGLWAPVYVKGKVSSVDASGIEKFGNVNIFFDEDKTAEAYACNYLENKKFTSEDQVKAGDEVVVYGNLVKYGNVYELAKGCYLVSIGTATGINEVKAAQAENAAAYNLAGQKVGKDYKGVVVKNGKKFIQK